jgi:hypothetical protein
MAIIGMSVFVITFGLAAMPIFCGRKTPCVKPAIVTGGIIGSIFILLAMAVWAGACPCNQFDNPEKCGTESGDKSFCLLWFGKSCPPATGGVGYLRALVRPGGAFVCCVLGGLIGIFASILICMSPADSDADEQLMSEAKRVGGAVRQKLNALDGRASIRMCANAHQLLGLIALIIEVAILDHGKNPYGFTTYPGGNAPQGSFFPFTGPFSPLLPMFVILLAAMAKIGINRNWLNFLVTYNIGCILTTMLFLWFSGNIFENNSSTAGHNAACAYNGCTDAIADDDATQPQCLTRGAFMGIVYFLMALVSMLACFMFGKQARFADLGRDRDGENQQGQEMGTMTSSSQAI